MGVGILAPVPATILVSAVETCAEIGRVAFGSNAWELFTKIDQEYGDGLPVLIYPTHHYGDPDKLCAPGLATFRGTYLAITPAKAGKHPNPAVRPLVTIEEHSADTAWAIFWEVGNLVRLAQQGRVAITSLTAEGQKKPLAKGFVPRGPMLVKASFL
jgi:hypothetical protein